MFRFFKSYEEEQEEREYQDYVEDKVRNFVGYSHPEFSNNETTSSNEDDDLVDRIAEEQKRNPNAYSVIDYYANNPDALSELSSNNKFVIDECSLKSALDELNNLVGLQSVKNFINELVDHVRVQQDRKKMGLPTESQSLHMMFTGNPGTGKTTVARIVGRIMKALGVVNQGQFVETERNHLVAGYIGQTAEKTKEVIESALGGILFIDEAYALAKGGEQDFGKEAIDTIVKAMENHKDNLIVIVAGYTKEMEEFLNTNSGLKSRFPNVIEFEDYTAEELLEVTKLMINGKYELTKETEKALIELYNKKQIKGKNDSGNGRLARNEIEAAVRRQAKRLKQMGTYTKKDLLQLVLADFNIQQEETFDLEKELKKIIGNEKIKEHLRNLKTQLDIQKMRKEMGLEVVVSQALHMVFTGNPGTGKTTIARVIGKVMKEMGVLKRGHVVEVDRSDLVAEHVGQTAIKTKKKIDEALGGVLFIDEAYTLGKGGQNDFGREAIDTILKAMEDQRASLLVIVAGYKKEMEQYFFNMNTGLKSRFPHTFEFEDYTAVEMTKITWMITKKMKYNIKEDTARKLVNFYKLMKDEVAKENGRMARNMVENAIRQQAVRLSKLGRMPTKAEMIELTIDDFLSR